MNQLRVLFVAVVAGVSIAQALSVPIGRDINFPKDFDPERAKAIRSLVQNPRFEFRGGLVSEWAPDFGTRLSFTGDAASLNEFLASLRELRGVEMGMVLYQGRNDEMRRDSPWQLDFSQAHPQRLTVYLNLNATGIDWAKVALPAWPAP